MKRKLTALPWLLMAGLASGDAPAQNGPQGPIGAATSTVNLTPTVTQTVTQPGGTHLGVNNFNNIHYANQWCAKAGTLDDTCFSRAIDDIVANGPKGYAGRRMGTIIASAGIYTFNNTVHVPLGTNITITGATQDGAWGSVIGPGASHANMFQVDADSVNIERLCFFGDGLEDAITIGAPTAAAFDSHINWNWFINLHYAMHLVNYSGGDFSHNTSDSSVTSFIYSNQPAGDKRANNLILADNRVYGAQIGINLIGDHTVNYSNISITGGIFDHTTGAQAINITNVLNLSIIGTQFHDNAGIDIALGATSTTTIVGTSHADTGRSPISLNATQNTVVSAVSIHNCNVKSISGPQAGVLVVNANHTILTAISGLADYGKALCTNGINVNAGSIATVIAGVQLEIATGAEVANLDTTASYNLPVLTSVQNEAGGNLMFLGQVTTANPKRIVVSNAPRSNTLDIEGIQQGVGYNQIVRIQPHGGPTIVGGTESIGGGVTINSSTLLPQVGSPVPGHVACIKAAGPPVVIGYCSTVVSADGACTCN
jgi:hypothetical protein